MLRRITLLFLFTIICHLAMLGQALGLKNVQCNFVYDDARPSISKPVFSWKLTSNKRDVMQTAYEIKVAKSKKDLSSGKNLVWETSKRQGDQSAHIPYEGVSLDSKQNYYWQVVVWDNKGNSSKSSIMEWTSGIAASDWKAKWIETSNNEKQEQVVFFKKEFEVDKPIEIARLYITSHGIYEATLNDKKVGDQLLTPGWTTYHKRLQYQEYDVTAMLTKGHNAMSVGVAEGWYKGPLLGVHHVYGNKIALLSQLEIEYKDGSKELIVSDDSWKVSADGPFLSSGLYSGEVYDARKQAKEMSWSNAKLTEKQEFTQLIYSIAPPVRRHEVIKPKQIITTPNGEKVIDFGQNLIGRVRFSVKGNRGDSIILSHAEVLDREGNFYTRNLRHARQHIEYHLQGDNEESYEPVFTFQGFRYICIGGNKELINVDNIEAVVMHSNLSQTGTFTTSNPLLNQLQHNILWGQKSNFLDIPTDCPQRDERLGWTGDAQVFFNTATFNMNVSPFFTKWLADLRADQLDNGGVPGVIPNIWGTGENNIGQAGWADAATIIPWQYYKAYGDQKVLEDSYHSMLKWADYVASRSTNHLWDKSWHHGDWLHYMPKNVWDHAPAYTDKTVLAQAFYANTVQNIINTAQVLGKEEDVAKYTRLLKEIKDVFVKEFVSPNGAIMSNTQTAYILALQFDLLPEALRSQAADRLAKLVNQYDNHISTGFLGTPYICHVLSRFGYQDLAYKLLLQESYPSWLYPVKMGATTIWERWDGIRPDGTFQDEAMNSFNHYAYGAIGDWMYKNIGGVNQKANSVGYKNIVIAPQLGGNLSESATELETVYGKIVSSWKIEGKTMSLNVEIPPNANAEIVFPAIRTGKVLEAGKSVIQDLNQNTYAIGSGKYNFSFEVE